MLSILRGHIKYTALAGLALCEYKIWDKQEKNESAENVSRSHGRTSITLSVSFSRQYMKSLTKPARSRMPIAISGRRISLSEYCLGGAEPSIYSPIVSLPALSTAFTFKPPLRV